MAAGHDRFAPNPELWAYKGNGMNGKLGGMPTTYANNSLSRNKLIPGVKGRELTD